ncbi:CgeB family protein [Phycisphaera mikurensis]|uniref:Spore protein YkvP/CgeB glycosyl transferase-like domain-containing protein n=1 Tax=Phycisphaera mikurensis (strain NBRC 102666 / KCTC 22515 / FYK2301M01) TaxID=1142394 RepID=I0IA77_PHYMF|nr:glycosyltransferase [Phycisphaera mikurensis]MBB6441833.1 spore maturation protein CgeB [Phycisphaera mikurensis]BAM02165.1 hypothetical protein PSMK_00060 [Phycisphaera mikurensis NBRC 102666]
MKLVVLGLSISSSWGNGHATVFRALLKSFAQRGHGVVFLERDVPWYAGDARDNPDPDGVDLRLYASLEELRTDHAALVREADAVLIGSYVPDGPAVIDWAMQTAEAPVSFYDIDTPVTLAKLARGDKESLRVDQVPRLAAYFSFTGGRTLRKLEEELGSPRALPLYCAVDDGVYTPDAAVARDLDLGYMGTYSDDRQPTVERLLLDPARRLPGRRFALVGPMYPQRTSWTPNVERVEHLPPAGHPRFYRRQRFTLNVTRADMIAAGWAPSVRLFEAAACGTPVISDRWEGLGDVFEVGREILVADTADDAVRILEETPEAERAAIGAAARARVLQEHTAAHRAAELEAGLLAAGASR